MSCAESQLAAAHPPPDSRESLSVTISVRGRFHAFDLAHQLQKRGDLCRLITSYPRFKVREWGIPNAQISSAPAYEILNRALSRLPLSHSTRESYRVRLSERFDSLVAGQLPAGTRLFVGWSSECVASIRQAKALGARTIVERGSTHICFQDRILREEHARMGIRWDGIHPEFIERSLTEYAEADFISVPSTFVRKTFVENGVPRRKLLVIPYGCDLGVFQPRPKLDTTFRLIHCGQISIQKGVHVLIRAFAELRLPGAELWLVGAMTPEIAEILNHYPNASIFVKGPFPQSSLPEYYAQGSVFCLASFQEGLAMVIPQAMGCGLPVIATENSGAGDLVEEGKTGFVIPSGDVEALQEKILLFYRNPALRDEFAANVRAGGRIDLSWDRYGDQIVKAYRELLERPC